MAILCSVSAVDSIEDVTQVSDHSLGTSENIHQQPRKGCEQSSIPLQLPVPISSPWCTGGGPFSFTLPWSGADAPLPSEIPLYILSTQDLPRSITFHKTITHKQADQSFALSCHSCLASPESIPVGIRCACSHFVVLGVAFGGVSFNKKTRGPRWPRGPGDRKMKEPAEWPPDRSRNSSVRQT